MREPGKSPCDITISAPPMGHAGEKLARQYKEAERLRNEKSDVQKRIDRRKEYMGEVSKVWMESRRCEYYVKGSSINKQ